MKWLRWPWRRPEDRRVTEAHRRADEALREARAGQARGTELADSLERAGRRDAFGESMIELFRGRVPDDGAGGRR